MPYILSPIRRTLLEPDEEPRDPGELNYAVTRLCDLYVQGNLNYGSINDVIGALEGAKQEFYRRVAAPYEDAKIVQNGDVYTCRD